MSVEIPSGSLTALLGPSGGGKSTLLRVIAGLERPAAGTVEIDGRDATATPTQRRGVGFVFQHDAAFKHMTVHDNVAFGLKIRRRPRAEIRRRVAELLELVRLPGLADRYPSQLSGGQRQRLVHLGFEVRVDLVLHDGQRLLAQVSREEAEQLELHQGQIIFARPSRVRMFSN